MRKTPLSGILSGINRKAGSIRKTEVLGSWLYGVAYRIALRAKKTRDHRQRREYPISFQAEDRRSSDLVWRELQAHLDSEVQNLPTRLRAPFVLCCLEGRSRKEAAGDLCCNEGTVSSRIARARELLQKRLARRGVTLSATLCAGELCGQTSAASVPVGLTSKTVEAAMHAGVGASAEALVLAQGFGTVMGLARWHVGAMFFLGFGLLVAGASMQELVAPFEQPAASKAADSPPIDAPIRKDRFGDLLPEGAIARLGTERLRHNGSINRVAFSPDGLFLASSGNQGQVRLWEAATGRKVRAFVTLSGGISQCLAFSPDGSLLATDKEYTGIWDVATGALLRNLKSKHSGLATSMMFAPDGQSLVLGTSHDNSIWFYDPATGEAQRHFAGHTGPVLVSVFSKDGTMLASASKDGTARLWDVKTGLVIHTFKLDDEVVDVALSADGKLLATKTVKVVQLWDIASKKATHRFEQRSAPVRSLAFSPDCTILAFEGGLWDVATGMKRCTCEQANAYAMAFSPDSKTVATAGYSGIVGMYDAKTGKELPQSGASPNRAAFIGIQFTPDGKNVVTKGNDGVHLWDLEKQQPVYRLSQRDVHESLESPVISPDGKILATGSERDVTLWDAGTGRELRRLRGGSDVVEHGMHPTLAFSQDSKSIASGARTKTLRIWSVETGKEMQHFEGHERGIYLLAFAPDGKTLISASNDQTTRYWDVASGKEKHRETLKGDIRSYSPDFKLRVIRVKEAEFNWPLSIQDMRTGREVFRLHDVGGNWCAFSPDGKTMAMVGSEVSSPDREEPIQLVEVASGLIRARLPGHLGFVDGAAFSPDGRKLASACFDTTCLIWDVTGRVREGGTPGRLFSAAELEGLWRDLASEDAGRAFRAIWTLVDAGDHALPLLRDHLQPTAPVDERGVTQLVTELDSRDFKAREKAREALEQLEDLAAPVLRRTLAGELSAESRRSVTEILGKTEGPITTPMRLQSLRAIEALEQIGTIDAKKVLQTLSQGAPQARLTQEAQASLVRLAKRAESSR